MEAISFDRLPVAVTKIWDTVNRIETLLTKPEVSPKPQRFDFNGALDYLNKSGYTMSKSKQQKLCADGKIPCRKFNNRLVFEKSELDAWIESHTVTVGQSDAALTLARSANRKMRGGRK